MPSKPPIIPLVVFLINICTRITGTDHQGIHGPHNIIRARGTRDTRRTRGTTSGTRHGPDIRSTRLLFCVY